MIAPSSSGICTGASKLLWAGSALASVSDTEGSSGGCAASPEGCEEASCGLDEEVGVRRGVEGFFRSGSLSTDM